MTINVAMMVWLLFGYVVLSSISNAMDMKDRSFYGFLLRFLRNLTNSAAPFVERELHLNLPQLQASIIPPIQAEQLSVPDSKKDSPSV